MCSHDTFSTGRRGAFRTEGFEPMMCAHSACVTGVPHHVKVANVDGTPMRLRSQTSYGRCRRSRHRHEPQLVLEHRRRFPCVAQCSHVDALFVFRSSFFVTPLAGSVQYPSFTSPSDIPFTLPSLSHSSEALNSSRWFFSHMALCEEQARSTNTFCFAPRSA